MLRLFHESLTRRITDLDGRWFYRPDPDGCADWRSALPQDKKPIIIPSCWSCESGMLHYEGDVWMETEFYTVLPNIRLVFGAVNNDCDVYLDGSHIGHHYGPFTEFSFIVTDLAPGPHRLVLRTNNLHNEEDTIPLSNTDWFHYGGIIRSVEVHEFERAIIERVKLEYEIINSSVILTAKVALHSVGEVSGPIRLQLDGNVLAEAELTVDGTAEAVLRAKLSGISLWEPESPRLYTFTVEFAGDALRERTGFRTIEIKDRQFLLNGKPIFFKGVNRHEEHPDWGFAVPVNLAKKDVDIIRGMGCNFIRGSHYPNAKATLDYMDETGILFWEEVPMWQFKESHYTNDTVLSRAVQMHDEMVRRDHNHPCIVVWGLHNEVCSDTQAGWNATRLFRETIEKHDRSRLITYASKFPLTDICYEFADFIAINYYIGWYKGPLSDWPGFIDELSAYLDKTGNGHKPLVMSEFGAGAIYGDRETEAEVTWSENYQYDYLEYTLELFLNHPRMNGALIWQYCDIRAGTRTCESGIRRALSRPRSFNNKGIVNEHRQPKLAYYAAKKAFLK